MLSFVLLSPQIMSDILHRTTPNSFLSFDDYLLLTENILSEKIPRTGKYLNDKTFRYTRSNLERMQLGLNKTVLQQKLYNALTSLKQDWVWVVITEPWCGDASWGVPALYLVASATQKIDFRIMLRDDNQEWMKLYQTNGADSIPKLVCFDKSTGKELGTWGPRPQVLANEMVRWVSEGEADYTQIVRKLHSWYEQDMSREIQIELLDKVKVWLN